MLVVSVHTVVLGISDELDKFRELIAVHVALGLVEVIVKIDFALLVDLAKLFFWQHIVRPQTCVPIH